MPTNDVTRKVADIEVHLKYHGFNTEVKPGNPKTLDGQGIPAHTLTHIDVLEGDKRVAKLEFYVTLPEVLNSTHSGWPSYEHGESHDWIMFKGKKYPYLGPASLEHILAVINKKDPLRLDKTAAKVGTDVAQVIAISPDALYRMVEAGDWKRYADQVWGNPEVRFRQTRRMHFSVMDRIITENGGVVFNTGGDGMWEVDVVGLEDFEDTDPIAIGSRVASQAESGIRSQLIRLAHDNKDLRKHLLPILASDEDQGI